MGQLCSPLIFLYILFSHSPAKCTEKSQNKEKFEEINLFLIKSCTFSECQKLVFQLWESSRLQKFTDFCEIFEIDFRRKSPKYPQTASGYNPYLNIVKIWAGDEVRCQSYESEDTPYHLKFAIVLLKTICE